MSKKICKREKNTTPEFLVGPQSSLSKQTVFCTCTLPRVFETSCWILHKLQTSGNVWKNATQQPWDYPRQTGISKNVFCIFFPLCRLKKEICSPYRLTLKRGGNRRWKVWRGKLISSSGVQPDTYNFDKVRLRSSISGLSALKRVLSVDRSGGVMVLLGWNSPPVPGV